MSRTLVLRSPGLRDAAEGVALNVGHGSGKQGGRELRPTFSVLAVVLPQFGPHWRREATADCFPVILRTEDRLGLRILGVTYLPNDQTVI